MASRKIVVGLDFSPSSIASAGWAAEHFAPDADVVLAHVIELPRAPRFLRGAVPPADEIETAARDFAHSRMHDLASFITPGRCEWVTAVGRPHEELARLAMERGAELVVIGPHGDRPRPWKRLGTTAERLVRTSPTSILVARHPPAGSPKRILVAVDDAPVTPIILTHSKRLADDFDAKVTLLHVLNAPARSQILSMATAAVRSEPDRLAYVAGAMFEEGADWLANLARSGIGAERAESVVSSGNAAECILEIARNMPADLIVIGRHGTGQVLPALLGSTVNTVLHGAACPVLVVVEELDSIES